MISLHQITKGVLVTLFDSGSFNGELYTLFDIHRHYLKYIEHFRCLVTKISKRYDVYLIVSDSCITQLAIRSNE